MPLRWMKPRPRLNRWKRSNPGRRNPRRSHLKRCAEALVVRPRAVHARRGRCNRRIANVIRSDTLKRFGAKRQFKNLGDYAARAYVFADELDDGIHWRAGVEDPGDAGFLHQIKILLGDNAADQQKHVIHLVVL
jgi:hypothetical protein